ncbi:membrane protein YczE [Mycetocola spongiae]|uniref:membrane protein YczE n=1 Tax=Mycetocola spongiae TaxID=2859226 RepID=UPI001CF2EF7F|nr:hypothetical protein [Mycetocola spongiae]UCR89199.1 hypothetical protein KXZ72_00325 [Mycetocola spongiae]
MYFLTSPRLGIRSARLAIGLFFYGVALALFVRAGLGVSPWDVLAQGVARHTGLSFGLSVLAISLVIMLIWIPLRQRPGVGTVINAISVGPVADLILTVLPAPTHLAVQIGYFITAMLILAFSTALYIGAGMGPGPRDGLMTGFTGLTGAPVWVVRGTIEIIAALGGWFMGGGLGIGTVIFALGIGPMIQWALRVCRVRLVGGRVVTSDAEIGEARATVRRGRNHPEDGRSPDAPEPLNA